MERLAGEVVYYNEGKRFGFVSDPDDRQHFFHIRHIQPLNGARPAPRIGDIFSFSVQPSKNKPGFDEAIDLQLIRRALSLRPGVAQ